MYSMVFDTETTDLSKCFCYDVGYVIINNDNSEIEIAKHFVIEQVWHNNPLFSTAYYAEKRKGYVGLMRTRKATLKKWGYVMREMIRDINAYDITDAYAYNSAFDEKVFDFNCEWFKTSNPFDTVAIHDIWAYASNFITNFDDYKAFCEVNNFFTESGNYSGNAENAYRFISGDTDFTEQHMGLYDAEIEAEILKECINRGAEFATDYPLIQVLKRETKTPYKVMVDGKVIHEGEYTKKYFRNDNYRFKES